LKKLLLLFGFAIFLFSCKKEPKDPLALPNKYSSQGLGASANDFLGEGQFNAINIQVQYMPGYKLDDGALAELKTFLNGLCNKSGGISITQSQIGSNGDTLSVDEVAIIEKNNRTAYNLGKTIALYVLVTDGYHDAAGTLGFAYRNTSVCLFGKNIFSNSGGIYQVSRKTLEALVLEHELGHILGLVNIGSAMQTPHQDITNGKHCSNGDCLMYFEIETNAVGLLLSGNVPALDDNCRADLRANGGK
jgi:hypothetical protein